MKAISSSAIAVGAACALALTACGGSSSDSGSGTGKALTIGLSVPLSGPAAAAGTGQGCGVKAALTAANARGGVNGHKFEIDEVDNQYDPSVAASAARDFAAKNAFAVYVAGTATTDSSRPPLQARKIPLFSSADGAVFVPPKWEGDFGYYPPYATEATSAATFIADKLGKKMSFVYVGGAADASGAAFPKAVQGVGGTLAHVEGVPATTTDFAPVALKLKSVAAPVVYSQLIDTQLAGLQKAAAAIGYKPIWVIWPIGYGPTYLQLAGPLAQGNYVSQWATPATQTSDAQVKVFRKAVTDLGGKCADQVDDTNVATGYAVGQVMIYGVDKTSAGGKVPTTDSFIKSLNFKDQSFGTTPNMSYSAGSHAGVSGNTYWKITGVTGGGTLQSVAPFTPFPS
jgi:ABC-type branched-subunit amino acid transport system substrate-binding protein